jgi:hypothetical protein
MAEGKKGGDGEGARLRPSGALQLWPRTLVVKHWGGGQEGGVGREAGKAVDFVLRPVATVPGSRVNERHKTGDQRDKGERRDKGGRDAQVKERARAQVKERARTLEHARV